MATWEDGPEYAPLERPDSFAVPSSAVALLPAPPEPSPAEGAPTQAPDAYRAPSAAPLAELTIPDKDRRDPHEPYDVVQAALTQDTSAWSATHHRPPTRPFGPTTQQAQPTPLPQFDPNRPIASSTWSPPVQQLPAGTWGGGPAAVPAAPVAAAPAVVPAATAPATPAVTADGWFAPTAAATAAPAWSGTSAPGGSAGRRRVDVGRVARAMSPVVAGLLALGAIAALLGPVAVISPVTYLAAGLTAFLRSKVRANFVRTIFGLGLGFVLFLGFVTLIFDGTTAAMWWDSLAGVSSLASALTLAVLTAAMASAVRNGELRD